MAAQLINNPFIFATADVSASVVFPGRLKIVQIEYVGYQGATDTCEVQDALGNTVWYSVGSPGWETKRSGYIGWIKGLVVPANTTLPIATNIPTGRVLIYFE